MNLYDVQHKKGPYTIVDNIGPDQHEVGAVWSEHSVFVNIFYSIHWFCKQTMKAWSACAYVQAGLGLHCPLIA